MERKAIDCNGVAVLIDWVIYGVFKSINRFESKQSFDDIILIRCSLIHGFDSFCAIDATSCVITIFQ